MPHPFRVFTTNVMRPSQAPWVTSKLKAAFARFADLPTGAMWLAAPIKSDQTDEERSSVRPTESVLSTGFLARLTLSVFTTDKRPAMLSKCKALHGHIKSPSFLGTVVMSATCPSTTDNPRSYFVSSSCMRSVHFLSMSL